jgi:hypothetical protein
LKSLTNLQDIIRDDMTCTRPYLLQQLRVLMDYSMRKVMTRQTTAKVKPRWARIAVSCASAASAILQEQGLESLVTRVEALERANR